MANISRISGFKPAKSLVGGDWTSLIRQYDTATNTPAIFIGDIVTLDSSTGFVARATASTQTILGVVVATGSNNTNTFGEAGYFNPNDLGQRFAAANTSSVIGVVPAELSLFHAFSASGVDLDLVKGQLADFDVVAGDTVTGNSGMGIVANVNASLRLVEQVTDPRNDPTLADAQYMVKFENTEYAIN